MASNTALNDIDLKEIGKTFWNGRYLFLIVASIVFIILSLLALLPRIGRNHLVFLSSPAEILVVPHQPLFLNLDKSQTIQINWVPAENDLYRIQAVLVTRGSVPAGVQKTNMLERVLDMAVTAAVKEIATRDGALIDQHVKVLSDNIAFLEHLEAAYSQSVPSLGLRKEFQQSEQDILNMLSPMNDGMRIEAVRNMLNHDRLLTNSLLKEKELIGYSLSNRFENQNLHTANTARNVFNRYSILKSSLVSKNVWSETRTPAFQMKKDLKILGLIFILSIAAALGAVYFRAQMKYRKTPDNKN